MQQFYTGLVPSPTDYRTIMMSQVLDVKKPIPLTYTSPFNTKIKYQGTTPECVAYSMTTICEFLRKYFKEDIEFDPDWLYKQCKLIDGLDGVAGTYLKCALSVAYNIGMKPIGVKDTDLETIGKYKIPGYVMVDYGSIKQAIYNYGDILMGFTGSNPGWQTAYVRPPQPGEKIWGHATVGKDFPKIGILSRNQNSWGEQWGEKGMFYVPENYIPFESWAVLKTLPDNWHDLLNPLVKPAYVFRNDIHIGMQNIDVKHLQDYLVYYGCMTKEDVATGYGIFGNRTLAGVKLFQKRYGIIQTGYVSVLTRAKLNSL